MTRTSDPAKDQDLLAILKENARLPVSDIAKRLGVSRTTVQARMARLERDGSIAGYTIVPGEAELKRSNISAIVMLEMDLKRQPVAIGEFRKRADIVSCHTLSGQFDLVLELHCSDAIALDTAIDWIAGIDGVRRTMSSVRLASKFVKS